MTAILDYNHYVNLYVRPWTVIENARNCWTTWYILINFGISVQVNIYFLTTGMRYSLFMDTALLSISQAGYDQLVKMLITTRYI